MANDFGALVNAVHTASSPEMRINAANALASEIAAAAGRGEDVRAIFGSLVSSDVLVAIGPAQLAAIGQVQRYLANVAAGEVVPTLPNVNSVLNQLTAVLGGLGVGIPNPPSVPGLPQWPGLPFQIPQIPGLDPVKLIKCLSVSLGCSCGQGDIDFPGIDKKGDDPIRKLVDGGIDLIKRARDLAHEMERQAKQEAKDLEAAVSVATGAAREKLEAAKKDAEANAQDLGAKADQIGHTIATAIVSRW